MPWQEAMEDRFSAVMVNQPLGSPLFYMMPH
jgi:hypothetical protein